MAAKKNASKDAGSEILGRLRGDEIPLHKLEEHVTPERAAELRRRFIAEKTGQRLECIGSATIDYSIIYNRNAENVIGAVQIPLGVAGPVRVNGEHARGEFYVPMATTEGALIAATARGMKAISMSGGANACVVKDAMARAPVFELDSVIEAKEFKEWVQAHKEGIKAAAERTSEHSKFVDVQTFELGNNVWTRFTFSTGDAMGMNMVTIASEAAVEYIERGFPKAHMVAVTGNMCSDKKASAVNSLLGRGKSVMADVVIKKKVLESVFNTTAAAMVKTNIKKNLLGSARAGTGVHNGHFANMIAAIFAATGQDLAQVVDSSAGYTWAETRGSNNEDLYISVTLPSLEIGTVGGGSGLKHQREALSIMGVAGGASKLGDNAKKFAEIIGATVLAGELNLLGALANRELGRAHDKLGRSKVR